MGALPLALTAFAFRNISVPVPDVVPPPPVAGFPRLWFLLLLALALAALVAWQHGTSVWPPLQGRVAWTRPKP